MADDAEGGEAPQAVSLPEQGEQPSHQSYMTQAYGVLGQLPFGYPAGLQASDLAAYQTNMNAHLAQYQAAHALASASRTDSAERFYGVNPGSQRHGRWTEEEHQQFVSLMEKYGRSWTKVRYDIMSEKNLLTKRKRHSPPLRKTKKETVKSFCCCCCCCVNSVVFFFFSKEERKLSSLLISPNIFLL